MPRILGHRGAVLSNGTAFQNSLAAFKIALNSAEGFETDACLSADGEVFLVHEEYGANGQGLKPYLDDASFELIAGRRLDEMHKHEIKQLRLKCGSSIPTLQDAISLVGSYKDKILNIELKGCNVHYAVLEHLQNAFATGTLMPEQVILSSFDHTAMLEVRKTNPLFKLGALFVDASKTGKLIYPHTKSKACYIAISPETLASDIIATINPDYIIVPHMVASLELCADVAQMQGDAKLGVWVVSERQDKNPLAFLEKLKGQTHAEILDMIIVDDPQGLA